MGVYAHGTVGLASDDNPHGSGASDTGFADTRRLHLGHFFFPHRAAFTLWRAKKDDTYDRKAISGRADTPSFPDDHEAEGEAGSLHSGGWVHLGHLNVVRTTNSNSQTQSTGRSHNNTPRQVPAEVGLFRDAFLGPAPGPRPGSRPRYRPVVGARAPPDLSPRRLPSWHCRKSDRAKAIAVKRRVRGAAGNGQFIGRLAHTHNICLSPH